MKQIEDTKRDVVNEEIPNKFSTASSVFKRLHWTYLIAFVLITTSENLGHAYRYATLENYGLSRSTIERLYALVYLSSLIFGTFSVSLADRFGRRMVCFIGVICYILNAVTFNFSIILILILGHIVFGLADVIYFTVYEAWLIQEHHNRRLDLLSLQRILRNIYIAPAFFTIFSGIFAQFLVTFGGYTLPFNISIVIYICLLFFIWEFWTENYGIQHTNAFASFVIAARVIRADSRIVILGMSAILFEAAFTIYIVEWTPTIQYTSPDELPLGLGVIFSLKWLTQMIGAYLFEPLSKYFLAQSYMIVVFLLAAISMLLPVLFPHSFVIVLSSMLLFEFCLGLFRTSLGLLRSLYYPNEVRVTIMNYMRVPQTILIIIVLFGHFSLRTAWIICTCCNGISILCMIVLRCLKMPEERVHIQEEQILINNEISSPTFTLKQPQLRVNTHQSIIP